MNGNSTTAWRLKGEHAGTCNCVWACPCQFNGLPDKGNCEAILAWRVTEGHFGDTSLDGLVFGFAAHWPGAIHEGNGTRQVVIDEGASDEQREALESLARGEHGGAYFQIFATVCPNDRDPITAPIELEVDREARRARLRIGGVGESRIEPIVNLDISEDEHRVRIDLPNGFEYKQAEIGNSAEWSVSAGDPLSFAHENTYAQLYEFEWSNDQ
jgi:hypothetical protein